jgi:ferrochelatase
MRSRYSGLQDFDHAAALRPGVLLVNLGTPDAPDSASVRRYLAEFLWDPRVVELPRPVWWAILHGVILRVRPARSARAYRRVWTQQGSPLLVNSLAQAQALQAVLDREQQGLFRVAAAMRYGEPAIATAIDALADQGVNRLVVLPMYPQYSGTTTGSVFDALGQALSRRRWVPHLAFISGYHDDPGYVSAIAASIREYWDRNGSPARLLFSFHGIPRRYFLAGDPYHCHCQHTARLVAQALDLAPSRWAVSFQSRVGREEWLRPYTDETLEQWGGEGLQSVHVVCPGFAADCLETIDEIDEENRERFVHAGGGRFHYIPALNDRDDHVRALAALVHRVSASWTEWAQAEASNSRLQPNPRQQRARVLAAQR